EPALRHLAYGLGVNGAFRADLDACSAHRGILCPPGHPRCARATARGSVPAIYINPRSKSEEIVRQTHHAQDRHRQWIFTWARVPGSMYSSAFTKSTTARNCWACG